MYTVPRIVLVRPIFSGNVGAVCRLAANFGAPGVFLVNPSPLDWDEIDLLAVHSEEVSGRISVHETLASAVADCDEVIGTTARIKGTRTRTLDIGKFAAEWRESRNSSNPAIVFGSEENGLTNHELDVCSSLVTIPTSPAQPSLNLSHAVAVVLHELSGIELQSSQHQTASTSETEAMFEHLRRSLVETGYLNPQNPDHIFSEIRELLLRARPASREIRILRGLASLISRLAPR